MIGIEIILAIAPSAPSARQSYTKVLTELTEGVLTKEAFWRHLRQRSIEVSERQKKIINQLLDRFEGKLTTEKWKTPISSVLIS
jgi:Fic family protein